MHNIRMYENDLSGSDYPHTVTGYAAWFIGFFTVGPLVDYLTAEDHPALGIFFVLWAFLFILHTVLHNTHANRKMVNWQKDLRNKVRRLPPAQRKVIGLNNKDILSLTYAEASALSVAVDKMERLNAQLAEQNGRGAKALESINEYLAEQQREVAIQEEVKSEMKAKGLAESY